MQNFNKIQHVFMIKLSEENKNRGKLSQLVEKYLAKAYS